MGCGPLPEQRGISHLVGAVLLIGLTLTAAVLILAAGTATIGDVNEDNNVEVAGQTFQQTDEAFQAFARQDRNNERSVEIPESMQGDVQIEESSWKLRLNGNPECSSSTRNMGAMRYEGDEQTVGYEGGGIWKMTESGATMDSPPAMTYDQGSLSVRFPNITGELTSSNEIRASSNVSEQELQNRNLSKALYTDLDYDESGSYDIECPPDDLDQATLWIEGSDYASAWARYFETNFDDRLVKVETTGPIGPGDDVKVVFQLGDVSDPEYNITDFDVSRSSNSDPMEVEAEISNEGGLDGKDGLEQDVEFEYSGGPSGSDSDDDVELKSGESTTVSFEVPPGDIDPSTTYTVEVRTEDATEQVDIEFGSPPGVPNAALDPDVPQNVSTREDVEVNVTVENTGGMTAYENVEFQYKEPSDSTWTSVGNDSVTAHPGPPHENATFDLPTDSPGLYEWRAIIDGSIVSGQYAVGSNPYFSIKETDGDDVVSSHNEYQLDVTIENVGHLQGEMPVNVTIQRNESGGWSHVDSMTTTKTIGGTVHPSNEADVTYRNTFTTHGEYRYNVSTENETTAETFHVGAPEKPTLVVDSVEINRNPTTFDSYAWFNVTVENAGPEVANQEIQVLTESDEPIVTKPVTVGPGNTQTVRQQALITDSRFRLAHNTVSVRTANASVPKTLIVEEKTERNGTNVVTNRKVKAEITVLGAELEGAYSYRGTNYVQHAITEMWLDVENETHSERVDLWQEEYGGDVNHPKAEQAMIENSTAYTVTRTFGAGSEISLFARSHECYYTQETGVVFEDIMPDNEDARALSCTSDGERITISDESNSSNVVILSDGDEVPATGAADYYQRDLDEMLGHRIDDDGTLSLGRDEFVFLYELSNEDAHPDDATGEGDPDYNDAVGLFRVVGIDRTEQRPANFEIEDVEAPESVPKGEPAQITVAVNNTGGKTGNTTVIFDMQNQTEQEEMTNNLDPGETDTVTLDIPTDIDPDSYQYTVLLGSAPLETHYGAITIGEPDGPNFQITSLSAPTISETHESPTAEVEVTNVGNRMGTQSVRLLNGSYGPSDEVNETELDLASHDPKTIPMELPESDTSGYETFKVKTDNTTTREQRIYYGESNVQIENLAIGTSTYGRGDDLIERRNADTMSFKLENDGDIGGTRDVELHVRNDTWSETFDEDDLQVGEGRIYSPYPKWLSFPVDLDESYYEYTLTVDDHSRVEDSWEGELFISPEADTGGGMNSSSPISVDSNQVVISD